MRWARASFPIGLFMACCLVSSALGAEIPDGTESEGVFSWLRDVAYALVVFGLLGWFIWSSTRRTKAYIKVANQHMVQTEKYQEEVLSLLREIARRPRQTQEPPPLK